jgi:hypothetical protein
LASSMRSGLRHTRLNAFDFFQENTLQDLWICVPLGSPVPNTTCVSVDRVLVHLRMETFLHLRRNFLNGNGNWALACIASKRRCVSGIMKSQMAIRLFFLP